MAYKELQIHIHMEPTTRNRESNMALYGVDCNNTFLSLLIGNLYDGQFIINRSDALVPGIGAVHQTMIAALYEDYVDSFTSDILHRRSHFAERMYERMRNDPRIIVDDLPDGRYRVQRIPQ